MEKPLEYRIEQVTSEDRKIFSSKWNGIYVICLVIYFLIISLLGYWSHWNWELINFVVIVFTVVYAAVLFLVRFLDHLSSKSHQKIIYRGIITDTYHRGGKYPLTTVFLGSEELVISDIGFHGQYKVGDRVEIEYFWLKDNKRGGGIRMKKIASF